jgi:hypothetical protein
MPDKHQFYSGETPDCTSAKCKEVEPQLQKVCKSNKWPPGHKVLVCDASGQCCYCLCH